MLKKNSLKSVSAIMGTAFVVSLTAAPMVNATENPFHMTDLSSGYMVADSQEGKCGEGKCGDKKAEGKCGEGKCGDKKAEGKCGEGKCGDKKAEGKCGEGKCGDKKAE